MLSHFLYAPSQAKSQKKGEKLKDRKNKRQKVITRKKSSSDNKRWGKVSRKN